MKTLLLIILITSCNNSVYIKKSLKNSIEVGNKTALSFWSSHGNSLNLKTPSAQATLKQTYRNRHMVMVSFVGNENLFNYLISLKQTQLISEKGFALVDATNLQLRKILAQKAHKNSQRSFLNYSPALKQTQLSSKNDIAPVDATNIEFRKTSALQAPSYFSCGNIEKIYFNLLAKKQIIIPPYIKSYAKLNNFNATLNQVAKQNLLTSINKLAALHSRRYFSSTGEQASDVVFDLFSSINSPELDYIKIVKYDHSTNIKELKQKSIIVKIAGTDKNETNKILIFGSHLDSINATAEDGRSPGVDDNATGVATLVEMLRIIVKNKLRFKRSIELHAYAGEEDGLLGSGDISNQYANAKKQIVSMMQFDMTSYTEGETKAKIFLVINDTSSILRTHAKNIINTYFEGNFAEKVLTAGTSDHKSWFNHGFHTIFPFEDPAAHNPYIHTQNDNFDTTNNMKQGVLFTKFGLAYAAHFGGLNNFKASLDNFDSIKLAITKKNNSFDIYIAAHNTIESLIVCLNNSFKNGSCNEKQYKLNKLYSSNTSNYFHISLKEDNFLSNNYLTALGFDLKQKLQALRTTQLSSTYSALNLKQKFNVIKD